MKIKWHLGLERALVENKMSWQVLNVVPIINNYFSGPKSLGNTKFKFIKTKNQMFGFGLVEKKSSNQVKYFYSDMEKTYLDFLYFLSYRGKNLEIVKKQLDFKVKRNKILKYAKKYSMKVQEAIWSTQK